MIQDWFKEAKLGIFIHWGIYAIQKRGGESWPFFNGEVSYDEYMTQLNAFNPTVFDAEAWADLIAKSGARYAVLTTKHHDGVALWPTRQDGPSVVNERRKTNPEFPDIVADYVKAIRNKGLKTGLYFSHTDWSHSEHMQVLMDWSMEELQQARASTFDYRKRLRSGEQKERPDFDEKWQHFLDYHRAQLGEILGDYGPIDLIWFDVMMSRGYDFHCKDIRDFIHSKNAETVINSRLREFGDYETPEQFIPVNGPKGPWEFCVTTNNTWSYTGREQDYKSAFEIIMMFCECLGMGGNMLLNIGPDENGHVPEQQQDLLLALGKWIEKHEEAVYETQRGLPHGYAYHQTSLSKDKQHVYLYVGHDSKEATPVKGIRNEIEKITVMGSGAECSYKRIGGAPWMNVPGTLWIDIPADQRDEQVTVIRIDLKDPLDLYTGEGVEIDIN